MTGQVPGGAGRFSEDGHGLRMGILEHLLELRNRLFKAFIMVIIGTVLGFFIAGPIVDYMRQPYCRAVGVEELCKLDLLGPTEGVIVYMRVALLVGGVFAIPVITYQLMMFVLPGLTVRERKYILSSLPAITFLFLVGVLFAWFVLMPPALNFLEEFQSESFRTAWTADLYFSFITALVFWMGVAFETPLVFFILALLGIVTASGLAKQWRIAIVVAAIAAAVITPTVDPANMLLVMVPLVGLYALSIGLVYLGRRIARIDS
ncbi:twin-arginine translocase subunit TatC [Anaerolineales bacterium]